MEVEPSQPTEPHKKGNPISKIIWLFAAFIPAAVAMGCMMMKVDFGNGVLILLFILNAACSHIAAAKLLDGLKNKQMQIGLRTLLGFAFFLLNVVIAVYAGCSMG